MVGSLAQWEINIKDIEVEKRIGFGSFAEVGLFLILFHSYFFTYGFIPIYRFTRQDGEAWKLLSKFFFLLLLVINRYFFFFFFFFFLFINLFYFIFQFSFFFFWKLLREFTTETSLMSKLHHRNVLSFYGAYCKPPNLCIVTEWMARGR